MGKKGGFLGGLFGGGGQKIKLPEQPKPPSEGEIAATAEEEARKKRAAAAASGRQATLLTGDLGAAPTERKTLLGA